MQDIAKVKRNIASMIDQGAPESDIDAYVASESVTLDMLQGAPKAPASPQQAQPSQPKAPRGTQATYQPLERFIKAKYPNAKFTSDYRDPQHNKAVGGVEGSYHTTRQAVDMTGLTDAERAGVKKDLLAAGVNPREFLYHNAGRGMHLHIAADALPDDFVKQWGNQPSEAPKLSPEDFKTEFRKRIIDGASDDELTAFAGQNNATVNMDELAAYRKSGSKDVQVVANEAKPEGWGDTAINALKSAGRGVVDSISGAASMAPEALGLAIGGPAASKLLGTVAAPLTGAMREGVDKDYTDVVGEPQANTTGERYINAAARGVGQVAVPLGPAGGLSKARRALLALTAGTGSGVGGEAAADIAPTLGADPDKARMVGQVLGGVAGASPAALGPIGDARFVGKQLKNNPYAAYDAEIAQELTDLTKGRASAKTDPKGRADVTIKVVNSLEGRYLRGFKEKLNTLDISPDRKRVLKEAIEGKHDIPVADLEALRGTVEGDAIYHGIIKTQRLRELTPEIKKMGGLAKLTKFALDATGVLGGGAAGGPLGGAGGLATSRLITKVLTGNGDAEAARVHSAERVIKRNSAYKKLQDKTGPSGQTEAQNALNEKVDAATTSRAEAQANVRAEREANAEARKQSQAEREAEAKRKADLKASRGGLNDNQFLKTELHPPRAVDPRDLAADASRKSVAKAASALAKLEREGARTSTKIDAELNKAPKARKRSPEDIAIDLNIKQGLKGSGGSTGFLADIIGVDPADVIKALDKIEVPEGLEFEVEKLRHGYAAKRPATNVLIPRLKAVLEKDGTVAARKGNSRAQSKVDVSNIVGALPEKRLAPANVGKDGKVYVGDTDTTHFHVTEKYPGVEFTGETGFVSPDGKYLNRAESLKWVNKRGANVSPSSNMSGELDALDYKEQRGKAKPVKGDYRPIVRKDLYEKGTAQSQKTQRATADNMKASVSQEIVAATADDVEHIIANERTAEASLRYFDEKVAPRLADEFTPSEVSELRGWVDRIAQGKRHKTDAQFERATKR